MQRVDAHSSLGVSGEAENLARRASVHSRQAVRRGPPSIRTAVLQAQQRVCAQVRIRHSKETRTDAHTGAHEPGAHTPSHALARTGAQAEL